MSYAHTRIEGFAAEPKQRVSQNGKSMLDISVAHTPRRLNKQTNEWEDVTDRNGAKITVWARATFFDEEAHEFARLVGKGTLIEVEGEPRVSAYLDNGGQPQASIELHRPKLKIIPRAPRQGVPGAGSGVGAGSWSSGQGSGPQSADFGGGFDDEPF